MGSERPAWLNYTTSTRITTKSVNNKLASIAILLHTYDIEHVHRKKSTISHIVTRIKQHVKDQRREAG